MSEPGSDREGSHVCSYRFSKAVPTYLFFHQVMPVFLTQRLVFVLGTLGRIFSHRICEDLYRGSTCSRYSDILRCGPICEIGIVRLCLTARYMLNRFKAYITALRLWERVHNDQQRPYAIRNSSYRTAKSRHRRKALGLASRENAHLKYYENKHVQTYLIDDDI